MPEFKKNTSPAMKRSGFKMKGYAYPGISPLQSGKYPKGKSMVDKDSDGTPDYIQNPNPPKTNVKPKRLKGSKSLEKKETTKLKYGPDGTQIGPKVPKGHSVTPPTSSQSKKSKGTLKGKTGFQTDIIPVTNVIKKGVKTLKNIYLAPGEKLMKTRKKIKKYFTQR